MMGRIIDYRPLQQFITDNNVTRMDPSPASFMGAGEEYVLVDETTFTTQDGRTLTLADLPGGSSIKVIA
jgi:hypothetical protein